MLSKLLVKICNYIIYLITHKRASIYFSNISFRYINLLNEAKVNGEVISCNLSYKYVQIDHLIWMLNEILHNDNMSFSKKHRWLGYVQGIMISNDIISVEDERNETRGLFLGD